MGFCCINRLQSVVLMHLQVKANANGKMTKNNNELHHKFHLGERIFFRINHNNKLLAVYQLHPKCNFCSLNFNGVLMWIITSVQNLMWLIF